MCFLDIMKLIIYTKGKKSMDALFPYAVNLVAGIFLIVIFYKIIKGIINLVKGVTSDVKYITEKSREKKERNVNLHLLADDIVECIKKQCPDISLIEKILLLCNKDLTIYLKDGRILEYSFEKHGFKVSFGYEELADMLAQRLFLTKERLTYESGWDAYGRSTYSLSGYSLISNDLLEKKRKMQEQKDRLKRC